MVAKQLPSDKNGKQLWSNSRPQLSLLMMFRGRVVNKSRRHFLLGFLIVCFATQSGCGGSRGDISGKVTLQGKTVASGNVMAVASDGIPYYGKIEADGTFKITDVPAGVAKIAVNSPNPVPDPGKVAAAKAGAKRGGREQENPITATPTSDPKLWFAIPAKYGDPNTSGKEVTIKSGANTVNIDLE